MLMPEDDEKIKELIAENNDISISEINEKLGCKVCDETVRKRVIELGYHRKKKSLYVSERDRLRCKKWQKKWAENLSNFPKNNLVFIDEGGVNTDMTSLYGRAEGGARYVDKVPLNTLASTTIISSIRLNGETAHTTFSGGTTGEKFVDYLKNILIPMLKKAI